MSGEPMYEPFAQEYAAHAVDSAFNAYGDRPAVLALIGGAACGPGLYAQELPRRGARVVGCDPEVFRRLSDSPAFIAFRLVPGRER